jgi:hypothetical protein
MLNATARAAGARATGEAVGRVGEGGALLLHRQVTANAYANCREQAQPDAELASELDV